MNIAIFVFAHNSLYEYKIKKQFEIIESIAHSILYKCHKFECSGYILQSR